MPDLFNGRPQKERRIVGRLLISVMRGFQCDQFVENVYTLAVSVVNIDTGLEHGCQWEFPRGDGQPRHLQTYVRINR